MAHDISNGNGRIHMNILWEMGGAAEVMEGILEGAKGLVHGVTCGAGMPYRLSELAAKHGVYYHPIISSMRAFRERGLPAGHRGSARLLYPRGRQSIHQLHRHRSL